uniref:Tankyrase 1-binding protein C-terminal domain-containing protein n=1 Tax=Ficedula albicollis TaxID=59894 RepID=A0A803VE80_FICAL
MNRLAGPQPYSGAGTGGPLRRPSFTVRSPETPNGKGLPSPLVTGTEEEAPPAPPTPSRKGPAPFKVTPVPVAARPERFPGTTVEEILAKMDSREGPGSPDRAWLSPFCTDPSSRFGSKTFAAFRKRPGGEADGDPAGEAPQTPRPAAGELGVGDVGHPVAEMSSSPPAGPSCAGDPRGRRRPPSPPDLSTLQLGALGPPGSPRPPSCPAPAPGAPFQPAEPSAPAPGSPDAAPELLAPDSPTLPPGSPESPARPPVEVLVTSIQAPGAPSATEPQHSISRSPGSPHTPGEGSPGTASPPGTPELPPRVTCPPGSPEAAAEYLGPPSPPLAKASCPPGSPEGPDDSTVSPRSHEGPDFKPPPRDVGLRRSSEGVLRPPPTGQGLGELGGSLSALPRPGDLLSEPSLGSESGWSLSQSFEWTFPSRGTRLPAFPPRSPIRETPDSGLSEEGESDGEAAAPSSPKDSSSEGPDSQQAEGAPCPGGPVAQREAEGSAEEEEDEREAEQDAPVSHSPLHVTKPGQDPAEPESTTQPSVTTAAPLDPAPPDPAAPADLAWAGDGPKSLQGPGGPGQAEGPSQDPDPHADPGWLTELLASPGVHGSPENLLGWSRKDLCSEFGIGHPRQDTTFDWSHPGVSRERDWPVETKQDQEFEAKSSWDSTHSDKDSSAPESWSGDYRATELMRDTKLGCSDWSQSLGTGKSCPQDPDFSASTAKWGQGYGSTEELGSGKANWGSGLGTGHVQQLDKEPRSGQPTWAGRYSSRNTEMKDRELTPDWASKYSSQDAGSKEENLTLGWAGRSSTGDTGSPDKEPRPAWDRRCNPRDMESQDREFSPCRPAWTSEYRDTEGQDREFSPSRPAWTGEIRDMESQDREFSPGRPAWTGEYREMESQDQKFSPSRQSWNDRSSTKDMESQDQEFSPSRPAWDDRSRTRDTESQDLDSWSVEPQDAEARRQEWASAFSARCAARSRDLGAEEQSLGGATSAEHGSAPNPSMDDIPAHPPAVEPPQSESPSPSEEERDPSEPTAAPQSPRTHPLVSEAASGIPADTGSEEQPSDHPDGESSSSWGEQRHSLATPQPEGSVEQGQEFPLLEVSGSGEIPITLPWDCLAITGRVCGWGSLPAVPQGQPWIEGPQHCCGSCGCAGWGRGSLAPRASSDLCPGLGRTQSSWTAACCAARPAWAASASTGRRPCAPPPPRGRAGSSGTPRVSPAGMGRRAGGLSWHRVVVTLSLCPHRAPASPSSVLRRGGSGGAPEPADARLALGQGGQGAALSWPQCLRHQGESLGLLAAVWKGGWNAGKQAGWVWGLAKDREEAVGGLGGQSTVFLPDLSLCPQAKLRGRNRSAEEGTSSGESKGTPPKDPHVQRSKSCKIPGVSGKPPTLPPKPEKSSGSEVSPPHWLQALKLKRKKP